MLETISIGSLLFEPFAPNAPKKVLTALGVESGKFANLDNFDGLEEGRILESIDILFPRLDIKAELEKLALINKNKQ